MLMILKKEHKEAGFTFLELLLVLSIVSILTMLILPVGEKWLINEAEEEALRTFIASVYQMQSYAMAYETTTELMLRNNGTSYTVHAYQTGKLETVERADFPEGMRIISTGAMRRLQFMGTGHIVQPGTITIVMSRRTVELRFQLQHGRIVIHER